LNEQGQIRKADIIQYVPTQPISQIPVGTYTKMYKTDMITCDGQFRFLTIAGKYLYEFNYSKGIMRNYKYMTTKTRSVTSTTLYGCVDWYEYTLSFDPNTGVTGIEYDYLYTVCQDDGCPPEDPTVAQSTLCGGTGGTGGDSGGEDFVNPADGGSGTIDYNGPSTDDNMALTAQKDWIVVQNTSGLWYIGSTERFNGVKNSIEIFGGHFTKITHLSSNVSAPGWTWQENSSVWFNSSDAYSSISGWLTDEHGGRDFIPTVTHDFTFNFVFP
jgi:hypothetical protein